MNRPLAAIVCVLVIVGLTIAGCGSAASSGSPTCYRGICIDLSLAEPVRYGEAVAVTITVRTESDVPDLRVILETGDDDVLVQENGQWVSRGPSQFSRAWQDRGGWRIDAKANQPVQIASAVKLPREGYFQLSAFAVVIPRGLDVMDSVNVHLTREGGVVNPTPARYTGTPFPAVTAARYTPAPTATPRLDR
jgi:hypothetical protein